MNYPSPRFDLIAPLGTSDCEPCYKGRSKLKPWDYACTACIPHLDTIEPLKMTIELLRYQTARPYILVIDTGSPTEVRDELELLRAEDVEIHFVAAHGWRASSEPVSVALDLSHALCRTEHLFQTHADVFMRRRDFLESLMRVTNPNTPVVGYRLSPREWAGREWEWMVGHTATMCYMPTLHRIGATWNFQRIFHAYGYKWQECGGWPDTETGFNRCLRDHGIDPVFIGHDRNYERQIDDNIDHFRSFTGSKIYSGEYHEKALLWYADAMNEARARIEIWKSGKPVITHHAPYPGGSCI